MATGAINVKRNKYHESPKEFRVYTPVDIAYYVFDVINGGNYRRILDLCCGDGNLSLPFKDSADYIAGIDVDDKSFAFPWSEFFQYDFLRFKGYDSYIREKVDLVMCNPPWNHCEGKKLFPYEFMKRIINVFGAEFPFVLFTPMGLTHNRRYGAKRELEVERFIEDGLEVSARISMPIDAFFPGDKSRGQQWEIFMFNIKTEKSFYWYTKKTMKDYRTRLAGTVGVQSIIEQLTGGFKDSSSYTGQPYPNQIANKIMPVQTMGNDGGIVYLQGSFFSK